MGTTDTTPNAYVRYNYQQLVKRKGPSCWVDLSTTCPQKGQPKG